MRAVSTWIALALVATLAAPAHGQVVVRYAWGADANAASGDQDWTGPTTYWQNLTVTGLSGLFDRITIDVAGPGMTEAWSFLDGFHLGAPGNSGGMDCFVTPAVSASAIVPGAEPIPGAQLTVDGMGGLTDPNVTFLTFVVDVSPPLSADPSKRYGLALFACNLQNAMAGYFGSRCPNAATPMCFRVQSASAHPAGLPQNVIVYFPLGGDDVIRWQGGSNTGYCLSTTPTRASTWGSLKSRYR